ncbi:MAG: TetR/AcrR family transcriptional regulator [Deltaproteobacteria bacterium]|nr:TetR/AcrR family transcriptional regulator [Deltaproteobacteria bacterium]
MANSKNNARVPKQNRGIESKEKIIKAATALFTEKGYHKTNAMEIAARAEIATGTFYSYFNNKKEVFAEIIERIFRNISENVLLNFELKTQDTPTNTYKEAHLLAHFLINRILSEYKVNSKLLKQILAMALLDKEIEKIRHKEEKKQIDLLVSFMHTYKEYIRISDFEAAAVLLLKCAEEMMHQIKFNSTGVEKERLIQQMEDIVLRYLLPES